MKPGSKAALQGVADFEKIFSDRKLLTNFLLEARQIDKSLGGRRADYGNRDCTFRFYARKPGDKYQPNLESDSSYKDTRQPVPELCLCFHINDSPKHSWFNFSKDVLVTVDKLLTPDIETKLIGTPLVTKKDLLDLLDADSTANEIAKKVLAEDYSALELLANNIHNKHNKGFVIGDFVHCIFGEYTGVVTDFDLTAGHYVVVTDWDRKHIVSFANGDLYNANEHEYADAIKRIKGKEWYADLRAKADRSHYCEKSEERTGKIGEFVNVKHNAYRKGGLIVGFDEEKKNYKVKDITGKDGVVWAGGIFSHDDSVILLMNQTEWRKYDAAFSKADWYNEFKKQYADALETSAKKVAEQEDAARIERKRRLRIAKAKAKAALALLELVKVGVPPTGEEKFSLVGADKVLELLDKYPNYKVFTMSGYGWKGKSYGEEEKQPKAAFDEKIKSLLNWAAASDVNINHDKKELRINSFSTNDLY